MNIQDIDLNEVKMQAAKLHLMYFAHFINTKLVFKNFHRAYYNIITLFAKGIIKKLIIQMPPQHGKSELSSKLLPAFLLGKNNSLKIGILSYSTTIARTFNTAIQNIMKSQEYAVLFPDASLNAARETMTKDYFETIQHGSVTAVGRGGSLTSKSLDVVIMDDLYKDYAEGNSPLIRENVWQWYTSVVSTRLHNNSQQLIVFTRWHEDDLIGRLEKENKIIDINNIEIQFNDAYWYRVNFPALMNHAKTGIDKRELNEPLWSERHSYEKLIQQQKLNPLQFLALFQGEPNNKESYLYNTFKTYNNIAEYGTIKNINAYIDIADGGEDYLCAVVYAVVESSEMYYNAESKRNERLLFFLIKDILHTNKGTDFTETRVINMLNENRVNICYIESNNGGSIFSKNVSRKTNTIIKTFAQHSNKESRIITNADYVNRYIIMPFDWQTRWQSVFEELTTFKHFFKANKHDDVEDVLTGIIEKEIFSRETKKGVKIR